MSQFTIPSVFTVIDKFTAPVKKMQKATRGFSDASIAAVDRVNRKVNSFIPSIGQAGKQLLAFASTAALTAAIIGGLSFSVGAVKDYEDAIASAKAITGQMTEAAFKPYKRQIELVADATKKSTIAIAKGFEIVGSAKPELLANAAALGKVTKAAILLSKASGDDLSLSAMSLTGVMNQFSLSAEYAERTMNVLAAGSVAGSANITNVAESMKNFGSVAAGANLSLEQSVALVEVLGKFSVFGAEAGTKLRGSILKLQKANLGYASGQFNTNDALLQARKRMDLLGSEAKKDQYLIKLFGAENVSTGKILINNIALFNEYTQAVTGTNTAVDQANVRSQSLSVRLEELKNKWVNIITSSNGATDSLNFAKSAIVLITNNMETLIKVVSYSIGLFLAVKAVLLIAKAAMIAYNVVLGISTALVYANAFALRGNTIALGAYKAATAVATAANWLFNASNPVGWIMILIGVIATVIYYWDSWGSSVTALVGIIAAFFSPAIAWLALIVSLVMSVYNNWQMLVDAFTNGGFIDGLIAIGKVLLDVILYPVQQLLGMLSKIPGLDIAGDWQNQLNDFRASLGLYTEEQESQAPEVVNPQLSKTEALSRSIEEKNSSLNVNFNNTPPGTTFDGDVDPDMFPNLSPSFGIK